MEVKQVAAAVNQAFKVATGQENIIAEDLSNIATAGKPLITSQQDRDNFVGAMADQIGHIKFVDREKTESAFDDLMRDGWEYGSILEKVSMKIPEAVENDSFGLVDGASYDQDIVRKPDVKARFWNQYTQFDIDITKPVMQINSALNSARQAYGFYAMMDTQVRNGAHK